MQLSTPVKMTLGVLPLAAFAAAILWLVYTAKLAEDIDDNVVTAADREHYRSTVAFQAVVASTLLYFALHHGLSHI